MSIIGRALECDLRLFSSSASRQHAKIEKRNEGWVLVPIEGRRVMVDGEFIDAEVLLQPQMRLSLGDDELVVVDQLVDAEPVVQHEAADGQERHGTAVASIRTYVFYGALAVIGLALLDILLRVLRG
ncbi:MAG TPA: FHA domain-containing protein [Candidatus Binatia bacterium]